MRKNRSGLSSFEKAKDAVFALIGVEDNKNPRPLAMIGESLNIHENNHYLSAMISILFNICKSVEDFRILHRLKLAGINCPEHAPKLRFRRSHKDRQTPAPKP